jgi:heme-degrading monooxygenase HmoA
MIYNTQAFIAPDKDKFVEAMASFHDDLDAAGGTDMVMYQSVDDPNRYFVAMWWPSAEICRQFARDHGQEMDERLGPVVTNAEREDLWNQI